MDTIREQDEDENEENFATQVDPTSFATNVMRVSRYRRSWPQTDQEIYQRYGVKIRSKGNKDDGYGSLPLYDVEKPQYAANKQVINWEHISEERTLEHDSVWNDGSGLFDIDIDGRELSRIANLFNSKGDHIKSMQITKDTVLAPKRVTTLSVATKRLGLRPSKFAKLAMDLRNLNDAGLDESIVNLMEASCVWPTPEELGLIKARVMVGQQLAEPDTLLWFLAIAVPNVEKQIQCMRIRFEFEEWVNNTIRAIGLIKSACMEICSSDLLQQLLGAALMIGNRINMANGGMAAHGVTLQSLSKLSKVKTSDKALSVLDCIVIYLEQSSPEVFGVVDECNCAVEAAKYSLKEQRELIKDVRARLEQTRLIFEMEDFFNKSMNKLWLIDRDLRRAKQSFDKALDYFEVPSSTNMDTDEFFGILSDFFICLDQAVSAHEARERKDAAMNRATLFRTGTRSDSVASTGSTRSGRLSILGRSGTGSVSKAFNLARPSIFGRMRPAAKEKT